MVRLLVLAFLFLALAYLAAGGLALVLGRRGDSSKPAAGVRRARSGSELVACAACGVHVPRSRAIEARRGSPAILFCSDICRHRARPAAETLRRRSA